MATLKEWQSPSTGIILARVTDGGFHMNGGYRASGQKNPTGSKLWNWGKTATEGFQFYHFDITVATAGVLFVNAFTIPAGAIVWACQLRVIDTTFAGGTTNGVGLGPVGSPEKYERGAQIPDFPTGNVPSVLLPNGLTALGADELVRVNGVESGVGMGDTVHTAGMVRARVVVEITQPLEFA